RRARARHQAENAEPEGWPEHSQSLDHRRFSKDDKLWSRQHGLQVDIEGSAAVAGHQVRDDTVLGPRLGTEPHEPRCAIGERAPGFSFDGGLDAASTNPALRWFAFDQ